MNEFPFPGPDERAYVSRDGKFIGLADAVAEYNEKQADPFKDWRLPWEYASNSGLLLDTEGYTIAQSRWRTLYRAFASLSLEEQKAFLMKGLGE